MEADKLWQIKKDEHGVNHWTINENFDTSSCKTITIKSDYVEQSEVYLLEDFDNDELLVAKNFYFDGSSHVAIPIEEGFDTSFIENEEHQFSVYDLDGCYAFLGGWSEMNMSYDDIAECINEEVFSNKKEELGEEDNETIIDEILYDYGTDTNTCLLKGKIEIEL